jgi:autotransporter-associated beta strand protein
MSKCESFVFRFAPIVVYAGLSLALCLTAQADSGAWTGTENVSWTNSANWTASPFPSGSDEATFNGSGNANTVIDLTGLASILNITFDTASAAAYTLGSGGTNGQTLTLENSGTMALSNTVANSQTVNAAVLLGTNTVSASYTFRSDDTDNTLNVEGDVAGAASGGTPGTKTLNLTGYGQIILNGILSNGGASALALNSYGTNTLAGDNTFSGSVTVYDGTLRLKHSGALGTGTKNVTAANNVNGRNPSFVLDGSAGDITLPASITFVTSNSRAGAVINESGNNTILGNFTLTGGDGATHLRSNAGKLTITGNMTPNQPDRQLYLRGDGDGEISGIIANGSTVTGLKVNKDAGAGTWTLSGANTFTGTTAISTGTLVLSGANGAIAASPSITVAANATLRLENTAAANNANRLKDSGTIALTSATFASANDGSSDSFSETAGTVTLSGFGNTISNAQAVSGQTSSLTLLSLVRTGAATVNFSGEGLGQSSRNRIFISDQDDGPIGPWATINGTLPALYSAALGVYAGTQTDIAAKGDTLVHNSANVMIVTEGTTGPNELSDAVTTIGTLAQNTVYASTVNTADKTLQVETVTIVADKADLTLGVSANDGVVATPAAGGTLTLINNSSSTLTVNAAIADNATASSLGKYGTGPAVLGGTNTFSGPAAIYQGSLVLANSLALQNAVLATGGLAFDSAVPGHAFTLGNITNAFSQTLEDTAANAVTLTVGNNQADSSFGGSLSGSGSLVKTGSGSLTLTGANTHTGGTTVSTGTLTASKNTALGTGPVANDGTLNLTVANTTYSGLSTSLSGTGTVNVTLGTGSNNNPLNGDYSGFTGVWNLGVTGTGGKAQMNGADNAAATVNVLSNAALLVNTAVTKNASAVLYGGTTGEAYGQLRLEAFANWAGPVTLAGDCPDPAKGLIGCNSGTGTISGVISDLNGAHPVNKVGGSTLVLSAPNSTYAGQTWLRQGTLLAAAIKNVGEASSLGQPATAEDGTIKLGNSTSGARLTYVGTGNTSDRVLDLAGTTNTVYLDQFGSGTMKFTSDLTYSGQGNKTLYLQGSTEGVGELAGVYANGDSAVNKLIKNGTGKWVLSNANTYSGETEIQDGTLALAHPNALAGTTQVKFTGTPSRNAVLELANDGENESPVYVNIGIGYCGTIASGVASGSVGIDHTLGDLSLSLVTLTVCRASSVLSGSPAVTLGSINLGGGGSHTTTLNPTDADMHLGSVAILANNYAKTLRLDGLSDGNTVTGMVYNGLNTLSVYKANTSTWTLSGANTYSGSTTVDGGTLVVSGENGSIGSNGTITVNAGALLCVSNTAAFNHANRIHDFAPIVMNGGTLDYGHTAGSADYSETLGTLVLGQNANVMTSSQAALGQTSTLTLSGLIRQGGTLDFEGTGLGENGQNRIFITGCAEGLIGPWATLNGGGYAAYSSAAGVHASSGVSVTNIAARGPDSVIPDDGSADVHITTAGETGDITLAGLTENSVFSLTQDTGTNATVYTAVKTLKATQVAISAGQANLTLGDSPGDGLLTALNAGGYLALGNDEATSALTVNAAIGDNTSASSLFKTGPGDVVLNGPCTYTGVTTLGDGRLIFSSALAQALPGVISGAGTLVKEGTNVLHLLGANTYTGPTYINAGTVRVDQNTAFGTSAGGVFIADGATLDVGCSPDVGGTRNTNSLNLGSEVFTVIGAGVGGMGAIVNNSLVSQNAVFGKIALAGDTTFGGTQRWDLRNNTPTLTMNGHTLTKVGPNTVGLTSASVIPGAGHIVITQGIIRLESAAKLNGDVSNTLTVRSGAELELYKVSNPQGWALFLENGSSFDAANLSDNGSTTQNRWTGPVTLNGAVTLTGDQPSTGTIYPYRADIQGEISGTGPLTKTGRSNIILSGTNTYTGQIRLTAGTLTVPRINNVGEAGPLGQQATAEDAAIKFNGGALAYTGPGETPDRTLELYSTGSASISHLGTGPLTFTNALAVTASGNKTLTLRGTAPDGEFSGSIANPAVGKVAVSKADTGTWTLSGNNSFTGDVSISNGKLILSGSNAQGLGAVTVGSAAANAILRLEAGCTLTSTGNSPGAGGIRLGNNGGAHAALYVTDGVIVTRTPKTGDDLAFTVGRVAGSYGYFSMSGGDVTTTRIQTGISGTTSTSNTIGMVRMTGGTLTLPDYILLARGKGCQSAFTVEGGTINHTNAGNNLSIGYEGGRGELNLTGGTLESYGRNLTVKQNTGYSGGATGIVNLCSGLLSIDLLQNTSPGVALLNFAGGTLKAGNVNSTVFVPTSFNGVYSYGAFGTFAGGAVIDTASRTVTLAAPLQAPAGNGIYAITLADKGSGFIGEPYVSIDGDGLGATAVANMEDDETGNGTYRVASITVTCPGGNYSTPPVVLFNGGGRSAVAPTVGTVTLAPNTSGGLTKFGDGTLTLGAANTYTGGTTIAAGTLKLGIAKALPTDTQVVLAGGTLDLNGSTVTNAISGSGTLTNGTIRTILSPAGEGVVGTNTLTLAACALTGTYLADVTATGDCDRVEVLGNIDLSNMSLQIIDTDQLDITKKYTLLTCTGVRTGKFIPPVLPDSRWHVVYRSDGSVELLYGEGTLIKLM